MGPVNILPLRRSIVVVFLLLGWLGISLAAPQVASAHAELVQAVPQPNAELSEPPRQLVLRFSEPLNTKLSRIELVDEAGKPLTRYGVQFSNKEPQTMSLNLPLSAPSGVYTVRWTTVSTIDGHVLRGSYVLFIGVPAQEGIGDRVPAGPDAGLPSMAVRWLAWIGLAAWLGGSLWAAFLLRASASPAIRRRSRLWVRWSPWLVLVGWLLDIVLQAASAAGGWASLFRTEIWLGLLWSGLHGRLLLLRWLTVLLAWTAAQLDMGLPRPKSSAASRETSIASLQLVLALVALGFTAASGHAATVQSIPASSVLFDAVHLAAGLAWGGGLLFAGWAAVPLLMRGKEERLGELLGLLRSFAPWALAGFLIVSLTGWLNTELQVGSWDALKSTPYGRFLQIKLVLVLVMALISCLHALVLRPLVSRMATVRVGNIQRAAWTALMRIEPVILLMILAVVAVLTTYPPARIAWESRPDVIGVPDPVPGSYRFEDAAGPYRLVLSVFPLEIGANTLEVEVTDVKNQPIPNAFVRFRLRGPSEDLGREFVETEKAGAGSYRGFGSFTEKGRWTVETILRIPGEDEYRTEFDFEVPVPGAAALIAQADAVMNQLQTLHKYNELGPGANGYEITEFDYVAPGRVSYIQKRTGHQTIVTHDSRYDLAPGETVWQKTPWPGLQPLVWPDFRWSEQVVDATILGSEVFNGVDCWIVSFRAPVYDAYYELWIGKQDYRVYKEHMIAPGHYMTSIYSNFNAPIEIEAPENVVEVSP